MILDPHERLVISSLGWVFRRTAPDLWADDYDTILELAPATRRAELGRQPLEVAVLRDLRVVARDWKTGEFLRGALRA